MQKKADKTQNTQTKTNPQNQRSGGTTFQFEDNRPEAILQRKLQAMADNSPQVKRLQSLQSMADNSSQVLQLQAFQEMADHCPKLQKALQLSALFNVQSASVLSQNQPNSMKFQGQLNTSTPPSSVQPNKTPRLSGDTALLDGVPEKEELVQGRFEAILRYDPPEEVELLQGKFEAMQRLGLEGDNLQMKTGSPSAPAQLKVESPPPKNNTGLPVNLKSGIESLSGISMNHVNVHYNSSQPAQLNARAYAQGSDIHVAQGQEQHLPHEAWHVVQQAQGRVKPTMHLKDGVPVNDDEGLEHEADVMGVRALAPIIQGRRFEGLFGGAAQLHSDPAHASCRQRVKDSPTKKLKTDEAESSETSQYWARVVIRAKEPKINYGPDDLEIASVSISPERRATKLQTEQGDHLVAWSAMYRYWNAELQGKLSIVLPKLKKLILADQTADESSNNDPGEKRALALYFIDKLLTGTGLTLNHVLDHVEKAISLFVEANQSSSFAVHGKASGGQDEGSSRIELEALNKLAGDPLNKDTIKEKADPISKIALNLIDIKGKQLSDKTLSKVCYTWLKMLTTLYPNLKKYFDDTAKATKFGAKSALDWAGEWEKSHFDAGKESVSESALKDKWKKTNWKETVKAKEEEPSTGVLVSAKPYGTMVGDDLKANEVSISYLELPETLRSKTKFGATQGSHTIAWTFKKASLLARLRDKTATEILALIKTLSERDAEHLNKDLKYDKDLFDQSVVLKKDIEVLMPKTMLLHNWITDINNTVITYIQINQLLPTTTYKAAGQAYGHGEAAANKAFSQQTLSYKELVVYAAKYVDIGIFYLPFLKKAEEYATSMKSSAGGNPIQNLLVELSSLKNKKSASDIQGELKGKIATEKNDIKEYEPKPTSSELVSAFFSRYPSGFNAWEVFRYLLDVARLTYAVTGGIMGSASLEKFDSLGNILKELRTWIPKRKELQKEEDISNDTFRKEIYDFLKGDYNDTYFTDIVPRKIENIEIQQANFRRQNASVKKADLSRLSERFAELYPPDTAIDKLYEGNKTVLAIVMADFYDDLKHVYPMFYTELIKDDAEKANLLAYILEAPLEQKDVVIGGPLFNHLQLNQPQYELYLAQMKGQIYNQKGAWAKSVFKDS